MVEEQKAPEGGDDYAAKLLKGVEGGAEPDNQ